MTNTVIYARFSSHNQTEQSIEGQLRVCTEYAEKKGFNIINQYIDRAISGTSDNRPAFLQMIEDAKLHEFTKILVYKLDRFSRNKYDSVVYKHKLKEFGVSVVSATEHISDTPEGVLLEGLLEMMAEMYSKDLSQKVKRGIRESILKGNFIGGNVLYGYKVENKKLVINEKTAPAVRYMFEQYAMGKPKKQIIQELNKMGYRNRNGRPITINTFQNNLSNKKYTGIFEINGLINNHYCPAIISQDLFNKVQAQLRRNKRMPASQKAKVEYLLTGKAFCGHCGANMVGISGTNHNKKRYKYYACSNSYKNHNCIKTNERKEYLENYVFNETLKHILSEENKKAVIDSIYKTLKTNPLVKSIKELEQQLNTVENELNKTFDLFYKTDSEELRSRLNQKTKDLEVEKQDITTELKKLKIASKIKHTKESINEYFNLFLEKNTNTESYKKRIINGFVNSVWVFNDKIIIYYNLFGPEPITYEDMLKDLKQNETGDFAVDRKEQNVLISSDMPRQVKLIRTPCQFFCFLINIILL